jgi:hypothetical protein
MLRSSDGKFQEILFLDMMEWTITLLILIKMKRILRTIFNNFCLLTSNPFSFAITRHSSGETLYNSTVIYNNGNLFVNMMFKYQYLEISTTLPLDTYLYGLGESTWPVFRLNKNESYTLWNLDIGRVNLYVDLY